MNEPILQLNLSGIKKVRSGKVREVFDLGDSFLLVASDRISAFDVIMPNGIPHKGAVLTQVSHFWFEEIRHARAEPPARQGQRPIARESPTLRRQISEALDDCEEGQAAGHRMHCARLSFRQRFEGI